MYKATPLGIYLSVCPSVCLSVRPHFLFASNTRVTPYYSRYEISKGSQKMGGFRIILADLSSMIDLRATKTQTASNSSRVGLHQCYERV